MIILWVCFISLKAFGDKLLEYRLGYNFGQVFQDFSYNSHTAVNGLSSTDTMSDVVFTDRGAYFDGNSAQITLPANDQSTNYFYLPSDFSMSMWVNSEAVDGLIFYRHKDDNNFFYMQRINSGKKIMIRLIINSLDTGENKSLGDTFPESTWILITLIISEMQLKIYSNLNNQLSLSLSSIYTETGNYQAHLGGLLNTKTAIKGFIYYFIINNDLSSYTSLILKSTIKTCLNDNGGCPSSCNPAIVDPYKGIGCLPTKTNYITDSLGNICNCMSNSCISLLCLECNCNTLSCVLDTNNIYCYCPIGYYLFNNQCLNCESTCLTCETSLTCLTCKTTYAKPDNIGCECINGYYPIETLINANSCALCYEECSSCQDYDFCISCVSENADPLQAGCKCKDGYWGISPLNSINSCQNCHEDCFLCENSYTCLLCKSIYAIPSNIGCECQPGYWGTSPLIYEDSCLPCADGCLLCDNRGMCLECISNNAVIVGENCICESGYYSIGSLISADSCQHCDVQCSECDSQYHCLFCTSVFAYALDTQGCNCLKGYFSLTSPSSVDSCQVCFEECAECDSSLHCLSCKSVNAIALEDKGCKCLDGYWNDTSLVQENSCKKCSDECSLCENGYSCLDCISLYSKPKDTGCQCIDGYYAIGALVLVDSCLPCAKECLSCQEEILCIECIAAHAVPDNNLGCVCDNGYYNIKDLSYEDACLPCADSCLTCQSATLCIDCIAAYAVPDNISGCVCDNGYYNIKDLSYEDACLPCADLCLTCQSATLCIDCIAAYAVPDNNLGCVCDNGYYNIKDLSYEDACLPCADSCLTCQSATLCIDCIAAYAVPDNNLGCVCDNGYYNIKDLSYEDACLPCLDSCLQCLGPNTCITCKDPNAILSSDSICICADGYYYDKDSKLCSPCNSDCEICENNNACSVCANSILENQYSLCFCKDGYFAIKQSPLLCSPCAQECLTCENASSCLTCKKESANFVNQTCECPDNSYEKSFKCICDPGFYMSFNETFYFCDKCYAACKTCSTFSNCLSCVNSDETLTGSGTCQKSCSKSEYLYNLTCKACAKLCLACESDKICTQCDENTILTEGICKCINGYIESDNHCISINFTANLDISTSNKLRLTFEKSLKETLKLQEITIKTVPNINFDINLYEFSSKTYYITPDFKSSVEKGTILTLIIIKNPLYSNDNSLLTTYEFSIILNQIENNKATTFSTSASKAIEAAAQTMVTTSIGTTIVSNPVAVWALINTLQLIYYLPLGSTPMTKGLQLFCSSLGNYNIVPNPMSMLISNNLTTPPYDEAEDFGLITSVFLINIGSNLLIICLFIVQLPIIVLLSKCEMRSIQRKANNLLKNYKYCFFIRFWTQAYIDTLIYAFIQLRSTSKSFLGNFNIAFALILAIISIITPPFVLVTSFINKNEIFNSTNTEFYKKYGTLYDEFKNNKGFISCLYYFIYFTRRLLYAIVQVFLNSWPFLQTILNIIISFTQLLFIVKYQPFKNWPIFVTNFVGELNTFLAFTLLVLFHFEFSDQYLDEIEGTIIFLIITAMGVHVIVDMYVFIIDMRDLWKKIEYKRAKAFLQATQGNKKSNGSAIHLNASLNIKLDIVK
ncbi:hypothetical protein SteCoe_1340 [Stentor coeruleus]|uniref:EGF-like domain-containing protein n=1 Tax=Stentor coeruleus TaxID=5963 RepID=A0A1R2D218_9CILI|nr:hypothetical protein SteCoe_1340 [Stentor coeruleus]